MQKTIKIKVIGAGGIGSYLVEPLARYVSCSEDDVEITVIDGDKYEEKNKARQKFAEFNNKADETVNLLKSDFPKVHFRAKSEYITPDNVISFIRENDVVMLCVDNHATRKLVSDRCAELKNVTLISGGNDYTDGNVICYLRRDGKDATVAPTALYPKIANPEDVNPGVVAIERSGCQEQTNEQPQLLFTNLAIASTMLNCYRLNEQDAIKFHQVYVDINSLCSRTSPDFL